MIRLRDSATLAFTKLRTRRIRLGITVFISSLIFSGLMTASFISNGVFHSVGSFSKEGFGSRYLISASANGTALDVFQNKEVIKRVSKLQKAEIAKKKIEAKKLGIMYDPASEPQAVEQYN
jgi:predicted transcriptional regulator